MTDKTLHLLWMIPVMIQEMLEEMHINPAYHKYPSVFYFSSDDFHLC